jgi:hypothetical protein
LRRGSIEHVVEAGISELLPQLRALLSQPRFVLGLELRPSWIACELDIQDDEP